MEINCVKEKYKVRKECQNEKNCIWVEQDILVPDTKPDIVKVINVCSKAFVDRVENIEGKIKISGKITSYILYVTGEKAKPYKTVTYTYPFNDVIKKENITKEHITNVAICVKNVIFQVPNERKINVKNELLLDITTCKEEENKEN